ncbi:hypothetical protein RIF29_25978 [Crotalaria pallida]|uniref:60S ribosomal protein L41 n=1 Tax=Crotalaria pallida TaxID=3830 RepID=A0AAN9EM67_CROPI
MRAKWKKKRMRRLKRKRRKMRQRSNVERVGHLCCSCLESMKSEDGSFQAAGKRVRSSKFSDCFALSVLYEHGATTISFNLWFIIASYVFVLADDENNVKALFRIGKARAALGQTDASREDFLKARKHAPRDKAIARELRLLAEHDKVIHQKQRVI